MAKVAWIGLGVMGYPMAGHLLTKGGHEVAVYNRNGAKAEALYMRHVRPGLAPGAAVEHLRLPSTSPAHAALPFAAKLRAWQVVCP